MINLFLIIALLFNAIFIFYQDYKERQVHLFALVVFIVFATVLQWHQHLFIEIYAIEVLANFLLSLLMLIGVYVYFKLIRKKNAVNMIGLGDLVLFLAYIVSYDTTSFIIHFAIALLVSLLIHLLFQKKYKKFQTVPLAGYMALYLGLQKMLFHWIP